MADQDADVNRFRQHHLPGGLVAANGVMSWVSAELDRFAHESPVSSGIEAGRTAGERRLFDSVARGEPRGTLAFVHQQQVRRTAVVMRPGTSSSLTTLGELVTLVEQLADRYRWRDFGATMFVLAAVTPEVPLASGTVAVRHGRSSTATRITLDIDPAVSPEQVARWYRQVRGSMAPRRWRPQSEKGYRLAGFYTERPEGEEVEAMRRGWNERHSAEHPDWAYPEGRTGRARFHRDAKAAQLRLLSEGWERPPDS